MFQWICDLFPLNRSLTGSGTNKTLDYFEALFPKFTRLTFESGAHVGDWTIPKVWEVESAYLLHLETGQVFADFQTNNLHLVGYSEPFEGTLSLNELLNRIHTLPEKPDCIPYVTSYYKPYWGFCMSHKTLLSMPSGDYKVVVHTTFSRVV